MIRMLRMRDRREGEEVFAFCFGDNLFRAPPAPQRFLLHPEGPARGNLHWHFICQSGEKSENPDEPRAGRA